MKIEKIVKISEPADKLYPNVCEIDYHHSSKLYAVKFTWNLAPVYLCSVCLLELLAELLKVDFTE